MKAQCKQFQDECIDRFDRTGEMQNFALEREHYAKCEECRTFVASLERINIHAKAEYSTMGKPDLHLLRSAIWDEIDTREQRQWFQSVPVFKPVALISLAIAVIAVSLYWIWPESGNETSKYLSNSAMYEVAIEELSPEEYPEQTIAELTRSELQFNLETYLLQTEEYETIQTFYEDQGIWEQVLSDVSAQRL